MLPVTTSAHGHLNFIITKESLLSDYKAKALEFFYLVSLKGRYCCEPGTPPRGGQFKPATERIRSVIGQPAERA
jgi:hypothetical protein